MEESSEDLKWMDEALKEAEKAGEIEEVPVGCVVVVDQQIVARGYNKRESLADPTAHAEILAIQQASRNLQRWRLSDATVYVTLEPCAMCAGALVNARVARVVYGCSDPKGGACDTLYQIGQDTRLNHRFEVTGGVRAEEAAQLLRDFFRERRKKNKRRDGREVEGA